MRGSRQTNLLFHFKMSFEKKNISLPKLSLVEQLVNLKLKNWEGI